MPKRPPRVVRELPVPADLCEPGPTCALIATSSGARGELWHADVLQLLGRLPDGSVDLVVTDPPYAINKAEWDEFESIDAYVAWCDLWLAEIARVLAPHGSAYVCGFSEILADVKARSARRFASCRWLVWYYRNKANLGRDWGRSHESILHLRNAGARVDVDAIRIPYNGHTTKYPARVQAVSSQYGGENARRDRWEPNPLGAKPRDVIELPVICNGMAEKTPHATQKPEALIEKLILASSRPGQLVVDPFVGSGTTAAVAARLGRAWLVGDGDPRFVGLARERLSAAAATIGARDEPDCAGGPGAPASKAGGRRAPRVDARAPSAAAKGGASARRVSGATAGARSTAEAASTALASRRDGPAERRSKRSPATADQAVAVRTTASRGAARAAPEGTSSHEVHGRRPAPGVEPTASPPTAQCALVFPPPGS